VKNWKIDRIISVATLVVAFAALILVLRKPAVVAPTQTSASSNSQLPSNQSRQSSQPSDATAPASDNSQSAGQADTLQSSRFATTQRTSQKSQSQQASQNQRQTQSPQTQSSQNAQISADELSAAIAQAAGAIPGSGGGQLSPNSDLGSMPAIKDQQISFDGDVVHGRFLTTIAGKDVWITISGHLGDKDGYATFDPTEFKVGDIDVPVSLVNGPLQRQLAAQRNKMKLPD
jgi:cytoskeletal protein RodZ